MKRKIFQNLVVLVLAFVLGINAMAQDVSIKGKVISVQTKEPIPGASVVIKGTTKGTATGIDGDFSFTVPANSTIIFKSVGYMSQEVVVGSQNEINIELADDIMAIDELVVIGYSTQRKGDVTSSVASVKSDNFIKGSVKDVGQLIQGKVAGLSISTVSGDPTSNTQIRLRGNTTLAKYGTTENPLVIIDGVPGDFNTVSPEDIESVDVLKDGSAAAIYGTQGTNGVIIVTTKRAKGTYKSNVEYSGYISTQTIAKKLDMCTAADVRNQIKLGYRDSIDDKGYSTDWLKEITRTPISHSHNLTFTGGNEQTNYLGSINYKELQGIFLKSDNNVANVRADINHSMFDNKVRVNLNVITRYNKYATTGDGVSFNGYTYRQASIYNPTAPVKNADGSWYEEIGAFNYDNPVSRLNECDGQNSTQFSRVNGSVAIEPVKGLIVKSLLSYSKYNETRGYSETKKHISTLRYGNNGFASNGMVESIDRLADLTAEYNKTSNKIHFSVLGGYSYRDNNKFENWMKNNNFPTDQFGYSNIQLGTGLKEGDPSTDIFSGRYATNLIGFFGRATFSFDDKYLFMGSLRREAASQLVGTDQPWGSFPAFSIGWRISKEPFMSSLTFVDDIKIRGGYGVTGTQPSASFLGVATMAYSGVFYSDGTWKKTLAPARNPNPYLRWEEKKETNLGFDFALFKGRIGGTFDYYKRETDGLLFEYPVPVPPNLVSTTIANVGVMRNTGFEFLLNVVPVRTSNFEWTSTITYSTNENKLVTLSNELYKSTSGYLDDGGTGEPIQTFTHRLEVGGKVGNFYGFKVVDVDSVGRWVYLNKKGERVESAKFARVDSNKMVLGNGLPKSYAGWNNTFRYKNFDLSISMRGAFGFQILNYDRMYLENTKTVQYNRLKSAYDKVFGKAVLSTKEDLEFNSYYIEDGDYWKIDNITVGYNFKLKDNKYIKEARFYVSTLNTYTFTKYKGIDPEVQTDGLEPGNDYRDKYPTTRTFTVGLNVKF